MRKLKLKIAVILITVATTLGCITTTALAEETEIETTAGGTEETEAESLIDETEEITEEDETEEIEETEAVITTGTLGDNNGIIWTYDSGAKTLTVTGEDSGIGYIVKYESWNWVGYSPFYNICSDVVNIVFEDCKLNGSIKYLFSRLRYLQNITFNNLDTSDASLRICY